MACLRRLIHIDNGVFAETVRCHLSAGRGGNR
jgi:hypothetical protein